MSRVTGLIVNTITVTTTSLGSSGWLDKDLRQNASTPRHLTPRILSSKRTSEKLYWVTTGNKS